MSLLNPVRKLAVGIGLVLPVLTVLLSCNKSESPKTFASPDAAGNALIEAAKSGDQNVVLALFGPNSKEVIYSGDATQDKQAFEAFLSSYQQMNRWRRLDDDTQVLVIGADNFPFPIPLKKTSSGQWSFDLAAGRDEILSRRVGRNELVTIDVCSALADAQNDYFSQSKGDGANHYALKFISSNGKRDGLFWEPSAGDAKSPLGPLVAFATDEGYQLKANSRQPFYGYYYRILNRQGTHAAGGAMDYLVNGEMVNGFAFLAYPAEYGASGIMTFIVSEDGEVYQKDLGTDTAKLAAAIAEFDPDESWSSVSDEE